MAAWLNVVKSTPRLDMENISTKINRIFYIIHEECLGPQTEKTVDLHFYGDDFFKSFLGILVDKNLMIYLSKIISLQESYNSQRGVVDSEEIICYDQIKKLRFNYLEDCPVKINYLPGEKTLVDSIIPILFSVRGILKYSMFREFVNVPSNAQEIVTLLDKILAKKNFVSLLENFK
jgi:hypothetical protein